MNWKPIHARIHWVFHLPVLTQTLPPHQATNSFLIGVRNLVMVDAGQWDEPLLGALSEFLRAEPGRSLRRLFLTHWHPDHCVGAERIREETGCRIGVPAYEAEKGMGRRWDFTFRDGDRFPVEGRELEVIHTPGHSEGHCCFLLRDPGILFTGDHILGRGTSIIVPPDGDMVLYLQSLERLLSCPAEIICPGHGPLVWNAREKILEYIEHRLERERRVLEAVRSGRRSPEEIVAQVYTEVPSFFHGMAAYTVQAHLLKLEREGRVRRGPDGTGYEPAG